MDDNSLNNYPGKSPMSQVYGYNPENASQPAPGNQKPGNGFVKKSSPFLWEFIKIILIAAVIVVPIRYFLFQPFIVKGESMVPTFQTGDYLIIDEISYRFTNPQRGDVVVLRYPLDESQRFIKRVIGLPGETVRIKNGAVRVVTGGQELLLDETYVPKNSFTDGDINITLGPDKYFVLGDNRPFSYDSRRWGVLPRKDIIGKAFFRVLPINNMGIIDEPTY
jgi:signal peptidase I